VETLQTSTLWQAAEASYAAEAPGGSPFLVHTSAIRRWAKSPTANTDLLTAFDMPLEALGHFTWAPYSEVEAAFVANMAASHPGPVARAVLTGLIALGHDPSNLPVVAETLFPGPAGLNRLIADAHFYGTFQGALPGLLKAYGLSGSAGVSYATHHPEDTALISALASTAITAQKAERLRSVLPRAADQMAFLAAFPYWGPPGTVTLERTATPYAKEVLLEDQYQSESSSHSASAMRPVLVELNRLANRYGIGRTQVGVHLSVLTAALNEDPSGFLARSVAAYVRVRHAPYFGLQR
jgi:hypothetical protein